MNTIKLYKILLRKKKLPLYFQIFKDIYFFKIGTKLQRGKILPVFLPFAGCPFQCIYCSQDTQTGVGHRAIAQTLQELQNRVQEICKKKSSETIPQNTSKTNSQKCIIKKAHSYSQTKTASHFIEIAFYGGTFTAISEADFSHCLRVFADSKKILEHHGFTVFGRCSTRPDCLDNTSRLLRMKNAGISLIELGIQSFDNDILASLGRGYTGEEARVACNKVHQAGFLLGIQLMPSSPNHVKNTRSSLHIKNEIKSQSIEIFHKDVETALSLLPDCMRYYPCLVLQNTPLAKVWREKNFTPWDLKTCVNALGYALYRAWEKEVPVIRLSVAHEEAFEKNILAGVRHPALGSLIQAQALRYAFLHAKKKYKKTAHLNILKQRISKKFFLTLIKPSLKQEKIKIILHNKKNAILKKTLELHIPNTFQGFVFGEKNNLKQDWEKDLLLKNIFFDSKVKKKKTRFVQKETLYASLQKNLPFKAKDDKKQRKILD